MENELSGQGVAECLIISVNQVVTPYPVYPIGAAYITAALNKGGHRAVHFDLLAGGGLAGLETALGEKKYDLVGLSIRNLDTVDSADPTEFLGDMERVARCVKRCSTAPLMLGGPGFSILPEPLMKTLDADYGVVGEGEDVVVQLASAVVAGKAPEEKLLKAGKPLDTIGKPHIAPNISRYYLGRGGMLNIQTKRGCPYKCNYCSYPTIEGRRIRYREPGAIAEEIQELVSEYGARYLFFADSVFNDPAKRYLEVAEAIIRRGISVPWCAFFRPADISRDELRILKRAGLAAIELGSDALTDETLSGLNKGFGFDEVVRVHNRIVAESIPCAHFVMFGGPGENRVTLDKGLKNITLLDHSVVFGFIGIRILPKTGIYDLSVKKDIISPEDPLLQPTFFYSPELSRHEIEMRVTAQFGKKQEWVFPCHEFNDRIAMLHQMGHAGPLWDLLLNGRRR